MKTLIVLLLISGQLMAQKVTKGKLDSIAHGGYGTVLVPDTSIHAITQVDGITTTPTLTYQPIVFIVQSGGHNPIIQYNHNGDLYYNPGLLCKCPYMKDTLIYWGNILKTNK